MKSIHYLRTAIFVLFLFSYSFSYSQLVVTAGGTPQQIINAFVGSGLTVSNVAINCGATGYGTFNGNATNIGLSDGILLTTGDVTMAPGPNTQNGAGYCWSMSAGAADPQLTQIEPNAIFDLCVLEFDFVPHCSSATFRFVFASEEYPEYVSSSVNDAFGIFLWGPGPSCQPNYYLGTNVATLPNGSPVSIDNINNGNWAACPTNQTSGPCNNCAYYVNNCGCTTIPCIQYDGFTIPILVNIGFCPCATYHMKIAIADAGDCVWDSGIFLEYTSCFAPFNYTVTTDSASCACSASAAVNIQTGTPPYTYLWSPGGQTTASVSGLCAGTYSVSVTDAASCSVPVTHTFSITNSSTLALTDTTTDASCSTCSDGSITLNATGGNPAYTYSISPAAGALSGNTFINLPPGDYQVCVTDSDSCTTCDSVYVDYITSVQALAAGQALYFYPNPFADKSMMRLNILLKENAVLQITDALGRMIKEVPVTSAEISVSRKEISAEGIYFYQLISGNEILGKGKLMVAGK
jgi:hypothetical protein